MSENKMNQLNLKTINHLLDYDFIVPDYQRGYRWTSIQVKQLLTDIWEFAKKENKSSSEFYCLQPIVVKKREENKYEVIDGQQRLTTIYLILKFIESEHLRRTLEEAYSKSIFKIDYDIRERSKVFLENVGEDNNGDCDSNVDFFHICESYKAIKLWFKENNFDFNSYNKFLATFLAKEDIDFPVKVIWYEIEAKDNTAIDIFIRLNIGKIPLTNSELIKALFLQKGNFSDKQASLKQIQIASEWDTIEKTLQDDSFWFFIYNPNNPIKYDNRIEYIFDLMKKRQIDSEFYHTFNEFYKDFSKNQKTDIDKIWLEIKKFFLTFEEWYKHHVLFHHIGYLIDCGVSINVIKDASENKTKIEFRDYLISQIKEQVDCNLDEIEYGDKRIKKILLLFNIQTILETQKSEMRFPFHKYKTENWDIEHVRSRTDKTISGKERITWIDDMLDYFFGSTNLSEGKELILSKSEEDAGKEFYNDLIDLKESEKIEDDKFEELFSQIQSYFNENKQIEEKNDISNLALLDAATNRSYGNSFFPIKRKRIIRNDSQGIFVPIATKNLFLKYYSKKVDNIMYWNESNAKDYLNAIKTKLKVFLHKEESNE
jgi:uncharacterized protein with ParB-like and HNH nuclease domain